MSAHSSPIPESCFPKSRSKENHLFFEALKSLDEIDFLSKIHRVSGASAEAINATLLALEYKVDEVCDILAKLNFNDFKDGIFGIIRDAKRLLLEFSRQKGDFFHDLIGKLIEKKTNQPDSKFADLARRLGSPKLHLVATNLNTRSSEVYFRDTTRTCWSRKPSDDPCPFSFSSLQFEKTTEYSSMAACRTTIRFGCLTAHNTLQSRIALDTPPTQKPTPRLSGRRLKTSSTKAGRYSRP